MTDVADHSPKPGEMVGVFHRDEEYRKTCQSPKTSQKKACKGGYHGNRWDAHHILPCEAFMGLEQFIMDNLEATSYDINKSYSMAGLPKLTAFILWAQNANKSGEDSIPYERRKERTVTMRRFGKVRQYKSQRRLPIEFPGELPVHNPCNWGHTQYNREVRDFLVKTIFNPMRQKAKKKPPEHFTPKQVLSLIEDARDQFWQQLNDIPREPGGGGLTGIKNNLRNRYGKAKNGWWKPMCMSRKVNVAPSSPSLR